MVIMANTKQKTKFGKNTDRVLGADVSTGSKGKTRTTLYLDSRNYKQFKRLCDKKGTTVSEAINAIICDALEQYS